MLENKKWTSLIYSKDMKKTKEGYIGKRGWKLNFEIRFRKHGRKKL